MNLYHFFEKRKKQKTQIIQCVPLATNVLTPDDCRPGQFFCDDDCHSSAIRCNGHYDCIDRSDELNCPAAYPHHTTRRPPTSGGGPLYPCPQHSCPNGVCYSESERCDGTPQCEDSSDELNCK